MAFTSYDDIVTAIGAGAGQDYAWQKVTTFTTAANSFWSLWSAPGVPGAGGYTGTALTATAYDASDAGALYFTDATAPNTLHLYYGAGGASTASATGTLTLWDRLLVYDDIDFNTTTNTLLSGDTLPRYTTGLGVRILVEVQTALGATPRTATVTYTNSGGTGSRTATFTTVASAAADRLAHASLVVPLQAGDVGVRTVQSCNLSAGTGAGTAALVLAYPLLTVPVTTVSVWTERDLVRQIPRLPRIYDDACLFWTWQATAAVGTPVFGGLISAVEG